MKRLLIIAGEHSGDLHGAGLVKAIRSRNADISCFGIGGPHMRAAGVETLVDAADMAVMGLTEVLKRYGFFRSVFHRMLREAASRRPDAVILIDYPGFNLRFAHRVHRLGIPVVYYICPQVWAWHRSRIQQMARCITRLITIFPFEREHFANTGLDVRYVGHPLVDETAHAWDRPRAKLPVNGMPLLALLPGSREHEVRRHLALMCESACRLEASYPSLCVLVAAPNEATAQLVHESLAPLTTKPSRIDVVTGQTRDVLRQAQSALVASGTATIEASLMLCPMVVVYRVAALTYWLGRLLVKVDNIGMVNIVAGRTICPEFIQDQAQAQPVADALAPLLVESDQRRDMIDRLQEVNHKLGPGGAADKAAIQVLDVLGIR